MISIIIPVRIETDYLAETIRHLESQKYQNFEILVITDKISQDPNPAKKRNIGSSMANGEILAFIDDDSYPHRNWLSSIVNQFNHDPKLAAVCGPCLTPPNDSLLQKASGGVWSTFLGSGGAGTFRNRVQRSRYVDDYPSVNLIVKKRDFDEIGGFDESFWPGEDTLLCLKLTKVLQKKILYHPTIVVYHHRRPVIIPHLQQITRYAIQRGFFAKKFPETSRKIGYFIPSLFTLYILFLIFFHHNFFFKLPLYLYVSILITTFFYFIFQENRIKTSFLATITIPLTHIYYGILFLHGLFKKEVTFKPHDFDPQTGKYIGG